MLGDPSFNFSDLSVCDMYIQIRNILAPGVADPHGTWSSCKLNIANCSAAQLEMVQGNFFLDNSRHCYKLLSYNFLCNLHQGSYSDFRKEFVSALTELGDSLTEGMFIDSCYVHCQTETQETWLSYDSPMLGKTVRVCIVFSLFVIFPP